MILWAEPKGKALNSLASLHSSPHLWLQVLDDWKAKITKTSSQKELLSHGVRAQPSRWCDVFMQPRRAQSLSPGADPEQAGVIIYLIWHGNVCVSMWLQQLAPRRNFGQGAENRWSSSVQCHHKMISARRPVSFWCLLNTLTFIHMSLLKQERSRLGGCVRMTTLEQVR